MAVLCGYEEMHTSPLLRGAQPLLIIFKLCFYCLCQITPNAIVVSHTNLNQGPACVEATLYSPLPSAWLILGSDWMNES